MPRGGHNRKPTKLHVLQGTDQPSRTNPNEPKPKPVTVVKVPPGMTPGARKAWKRLAPILERLELLTESDIETFTALCQAWGRYENAVKRLKKIEHVADPMEEIDIIRKAEVSVERAEHAFRLYGQEFGLSPASRARLQVSPGKKDDESILDRLWA